MQYSAGKAIPNTFPARKFLWLMALAGAVQYPSPASCCVAINSFLLGTDGLSFSQRSDSRTASFVESNQCKSLQLLWLPRLLCSGGSQALRLFDTCRNVLASKECLIAMLPK